MSTLFPRTISILRRVGSRVNGRWTTSEETSMNVTGSVQPVSGKDTQFLPEGRRDVGTVKVYCNERLNVSVEGSENSGDVVIWRGKKWEVFQELDFANDIINHYKYLAGYIGEAT